MGMYPRRNGFPAGKRGTSLPIILPHSCNQLTTVLCFKTSLPLDPVLVAISELLPKIRETQPLVGAPSEKVFNILKDVELADVLPPAPPITPRRFQVRPPFFFFTLLNRTDLLTVVARIMYLAHLSSLGGYLRRRPDKYRLMEGYPSEVVWDQAGACEGTRRASGQGFENDGCCLKRNG